MFNLLEYHLIDHALLSAHFDEKDRIHVLALQSKMQKMLNQDLIDIASPYISSAKDRTRGERIHIVESPKELALLLLDMATSNAQVGVFLPSQGTAYAWLEDIVPYLAEVDVKKTHTHNLSSLKFPSGMKVTVYSSYRSSMECLRGQNFDHIFIPNQNVRE